MITRDEGLKQLWCLFLSMPMTKFDWELLDQNMLWFTLHRSRIDWQYNRRIQVLRIIYSCQKLDQIDFLFLVLAKLERCVSFCIFKRFVDFLAIKQIAVKVESEVNSDVIEYFLFFLHAHNVFHARLQKNVSYDLRIACCEEDQIYLVACIT